MFGQIFQQIINSILTLVGELGYVGIFIGMAIESTIIPLPSEVILIPAGVLVAKGQMDFTTVLLAGTFGSLIGAWINYSLAFYLGRPAIEFLISKYGKILLVNKEKIRASESFFNKHGEITTFVGRLIPGARHIISIPAGFSRMNFFRFSLFTILGAGIWSSVLIFTGYFFGDHLVNSSNFILTIVFSISIIVIVLYLLLKERN